MIQTTKSHPTRNSQNEEPSNSFIFNVDLTGCITSPFENCSIAISNRFVNSVHGKHLSHSKSEKYLNRDSVIVTILPNSRG